MISNLPQNIADKLSSISKVIKSDIIDGAQWLSGRVLDSRPRGRGFQPHRRHCVVSLSKSIYPCLVLVQPRKAGPNITENFVDWDVKYQNKQSDVGLQ